MADRQAICRDDQSDDFARGVADLCATTATDRQWERFLDAHVSRVDKAGSPLKSRALTLAEKKRDILQRLYRDDMWVSTWAGTAHGVVQAANTFEHHESTVRGGHRAERNMLRTITGDFGKLDRITLSTLTRVLA